jgi:hypothetical protein
MFELHKATEALKKEYAEIEAEEKLMANLSELVTFIASFVSIFKKVFRCLEKKS